MEVGSSAPSDRDDDGDAPAADAHARDSVRDAANALHWIGLSKKLGLSPQESHLFQSRILCKPLGRGGPRFAKGSLLVVWKVFRGSIFLNPGRPAHKHVEFDFVNLTKPALEFLRQTLDEQTKEMDLSTRANRKYRGAYLVYATLVASMITDKSWSSVKSDKSKDRGPARLLFYRRGRRNAPHHDIKTDGRLLLAMANDPTKPISDLCFVNSATKCRVRIKRPPFSMTMGSDTLFGVCFTRRGHHVKHFTTAAPQFSATIALNPGWGSRDPSALAEQIAEFRDLIRLIFDGSI